MARALERRQRLSLEQLALQRGGQEPSTLQRAADNALSRQSAGISGRGSRAVGAREEVLIAAASAGELERLADLCREYEVPYRSAKSSRASTGARLMEEVTSGSAPAVCWCARRWRRVS